MLASLSHSVPCEDPAERRFYRFLRRIFETEIARALQPFTCSYGIVYREVYG